MDIPTVAIVGYTNAGKTSLIKALTKDASLQPRNQLFATLGISITANEHQDKMTRDEQYQIGIPVIPICEKDSRNFAVITLAVDFQPLPEGCCFTSDTPLTLSR